MDKEYWMVRLNLASSAKEAVRELAKADRRSTSAYISVIIEEKVKEAAHERQAR